MDPFFSNGHAGPPTQSIDAFDFDESLEEFEKRLPPPELVELDRLELPIQDNSSQSDDHQVPSMILGSERSSATENDIPAMVMGSQLSSLSEADRAWVIKDLIPDRNVTSIYGDGGIGKSMLALQLAVAHATGGQWIGQDILTFGPAYFLSCEDDEEEIKIRLGSILDKEGMEFSDLGNLGLVITADTDGTLFEAKGHGVKATPLFQRVEEDCRKIGAKLIIIDNISEALAGNFNDKHTVSKAVGHLRKLSKRLNAAVIFLAHPSGRSMERGDGSSGERAWNNGVRSRLYLYADKDDQSLLQLEHKKCNYSAKNKKIHVRWVGGCFEVSEARTSAAAPRKQNKNLKPPEVHKPLQNSRIAALEALLQPNGQPNPMSTPDIINALLNSPVDFGKNKNAVRQCIKRSLKYDAQRGGKLLSFVTDQTPTSVGLETDENSREKR